MASHILVAEDQADIRDLMVLNLRSAGYEVSAVADGRGRAGQPGRARQRPADPRPDDAGLDGLEVCKALRARGRATPILMLTAKSTELDRVLGLELGADDYLTKPFSMAELLARVKALLRRAELLRAAQAQPAQAAGACAQRRAGDPAGASARCAYRRRRAGLHRAGVRPAAALRQPPRARVLAHAAARRRLGLQHDGYEHTVTTHINRLRAKLEADPMHPQLILTVRGAGYKMRDAPDEPPAQRPAPVAGSWLTVRLADSR